MEMFGRIDAINQNPKTAVSEVAVDARRLEQAGDSVTVSRRDCVLQCVPGRGAIHRAGVYVSETDLLRELTRDTAFAGRGRSVDRNDTVSDWAVHSKNARRGLIATQAARLHPFIRRHPWRV
jgi:hypothetical protein